LIRKSGLCFRRRSFYTIFILTAAALLTAHAGLAHAPQSASAASSGELLLTLDADKSEFHWTLDTTLHTVHGTFKFKRGELRLNPASGVAKGEILVPATSADSGNEGRDKKMHKDVLESSQFQEILFTVDRVEGKVAPSGSSNVMLHGTMKLHGVDHEFGAPVQAEITGDHWKATAKFTIPFLKWGLKNPSTWLLKVKPDVDVDLTLTGTLKSAPQ
jgi:polyisoprenoid-binding protein YceI